MGASQSQPTVAPALTQIVSPPSYPLKPPANPSIEEIPRTKMPVKPTIEDLNLENLKPTLAFTQIDGKYLDSITKNPIAHLTSNQIDIVSGVKLLKFPESEVSFEPNSFVDTQLRTKIYYNYKETLLTFIKFMNREPIDIQLCGEDLEFILEIDFAVNKHTDKIIGFYHDKMFYQANPDVKSERINQILLKPSDFDQFKQRIVNDETFQGMKQYITDVFKRYKTSSINSVEKIKQELSTCRNRYYVVPIGFTWLREGNFTTNEGHQNLLILDKFNDQALIIEPQFYGKIISETNLHTQSEKLNRIYKDILNKLGLNYELIIPVTLYPQAIADDLNCMFWTFLITVTFFLNSGNVPIDTISSAILRKYPSKEELLSYIERFKFKINDYVLAYDNFKKKAAGKRRRKVTRRRKTRRNAQKRIMHANRKLQSTK